MPVPSKPLRDLTAGDLMTHEVVRLPEAMPLRDAALLLIRNHVGGAPVVDRQGKCIGVLSAIDFLRLTEKREDIARPFAPPLPVTCAFQAKHWTRDGKEVTVCTLPPGVCPIQVKQNAGPGEELLICSQPHCFLVDWQLATVEKLPDHEVRRFMTADPVTVQSETDIRTLARMMIDAHIHRIIVVDDEDRPIGVVSGTDILAAVAYSDDEH